MTVVNTGSILTAGFRRPLTPPSPGRLGETATSAVGVHPGRPMGKELVGWECENRIWVSAP